MGYLQVCFVLAAVIGAVAYYFPVVGLCIALLIAPSAAFGSVGALWGLITPLRVPDWLAPQKNRNLFCVMLALCSALLAASVPLLIWCWTRVTTSTAIWGAVLIAGLGTVLAERYGARNPEDRVKPWVRRNFPDIRGEARPIAVAAKQGKLVAIGEKVMTTVLAGILLHMIGMAISFDIYEESWCIYGLLSVRLTVSLVS